MRGNELLDKMELIDPAYIEAADDGKNTENRHKGARGIRRLPMVLVAAILALLLAGAGVAALVAVVYGDLWIESPSNDPVQSVRSAIENQINKDYTIKIEIESIAVDAEETERVVERFISGEIARRRGWSEEYLAEHFVVVKAVYYAQYDPALTTRSDGNVVQFFYLTRDPDSGKWSVVDNSGNVNWSSDIPKDEEPSNPVPSHEDQLFTYLSELFNTVYAPYYDGLHYEIQYENQTVCEDEWTAQFFWTMYFLGKGWEFERDEGTEQSGTMALQATVLIRDDGTLDLSTILIFADSAAEGAPAYTIPLEELFPDQLSN